MALLWLLHSPDARIRDYNAHLEVYVHRSPSHLDKRRTLLKSGGGAALLAAVFDLPAGTEPAISTRVKMAQTSNIYALVKADGKYFVAIKEVKVTLGGCGG
ncbi:MAG: hypothetical protein E6H78_08805 [Betaproteobacteria bacterium]|nr:MAG: hypothetical protein E6H78_08805 [Betaproteobacteria bacterium]